MITVASPKNFPKPLKEDDEEIHIEEDDETVEPSQAPLVFEEGSQATQDKLLEINLGLDEESRPIFINRNMSPKEKYIYLEFLKQD